MPSVVAAPTCNGAGTSPRNSAAVVPSNARPSAVRAPAIGRPLRGSITSPIALTATSAPTVIPSTVNDALPRPPRIARAMPNSLPTEQPVPAPTLPCATAASVAASHAA